MCFTPTILPHMHCQVAVGGADPTAAPECANRHAKIMAGAAIPDAARLPVYQKVIIISFPRGFGDYQFTKW